MGVNEQPQYLDFSLCWKQYIRRKNSISQSAYKAIPAV
jgi:hypothetical protein